MTLMADMALVACNVSSFGLVTVKSHLCRPIGPWLNHYSLQQSLLKHKYREAGGSVYLNRFGPNPFYQTSVHQASFQSNTLEERELDARWEVVGGTLGNREERLRYTFEPRTGHL